MKKIIFIIVCLSTIILIYFSAYKKENTYYIALGDSLAVGQNPYGGMGYSYNDYVYDYLKKHQKVEVYAKEFGQSGYRITDIINDITNNSSITLNDKLLTIKHALVKANLITVSIGGNDLFYKLKISTNPEEVNPDELKNYVDQILDDLDKLLKLMRIYSKEKILLVGYYNPLPKLTNQFDNIFIYVNEQATKIAKENDINYINIYNLFKENPDYLPNPFDIHPNIDGYKAISQKIIKTLSINK